MHRGTPAGKEKGREAIFEPTEFPQIVEHQTTAQRTLRGTIPK